MQIDVDVESEERPCQVDDEDAFLYMALTYAIVNSGGALRIPFAALESMAGQNVNFSFYFMDGDERLIVRVRKGREDRRE